MVPNTSLTALDMAFPATVSHLMPSYGDIPQEFKDGNTIWNKLVGQWFFGGVKNLKLKPKDGIDTTAALRHIKTILSSFEPKHEHKEAACAFLLSEWFTDPTWESSQRSARVEAEIRP